MIYTVKCFLIRRQVLLDRNSVPPCKERRSYVERWKVKELQSPLAAGGDTESGAIKAASHWCKISDTISTLANYPARVVLWYLAQCGCSFIAKTEKQPDVSDARSRISSRWRTTISLFIKPLAGAWNNANNANTFASLHIFIRSFLPTDETSRKVSPAIGKKLVASDVSELHCWAEK